MFKIYNCKEFIQHVEYFEIISCCVIKNESIKSTKSTFFVRIFSSIMKIDFSTFSVENKDKEL